MAKNAPVKCVTFGNTPESQPDLATALAVRNIDPESYGALLRAAGMTRLAENIKPILRADAAARDFPEISADDYQLYASHLSERTRLESWLQLPPEEIQHIVLPAITAAVKSGMFTEFFVLHHDETDEVMVVGVNKVASASRYYQIAHYGTELTSLETLRKRNRVRLQPLKRLLARTGKLASSVPFLLLAGMASVGLAWYATDLNWILAMFVLAGLLSTLYSVARKNSPEFSLERGVACAVLVVGLILGTIASIHHGLTYDRKLTTTVCGYDESYYSSMSGLQTVDGEVNLDGMLIDGRYYQAGSVNAAQLLDGKRVTLTVHGLPFGGNLYATKAVIHGDAPAC